MSSDTLLLNADGNPLSVTPLSTLTWQESIKLIWLDRINVLEWHDDWEVHSPSHTMKVPSVIAVREYVDRTNNVSFSRTNVFLRDKYICQYCQGLFHPRDLTMDHVVPRSKGGKLSWTNIVSACKKCNTTKADRLHPKPYKEPVAPNFYQMYANKTIDLQIRYPVWMKYLNIDTSKVKVS
jgi:5-methylcytosine-specific restriction endonuclease McrA